MRRCATSFRTIVLVTAVSLVHLLFLFPLTSAHLALARMPPVWNPPSIPQAETCVSPAMREAAYQEALRLVEEQAQTDPLGERMAVQLRRAYAEGTLPMAATDTCPQKVFDPVTIGIIIGVAVMVITFIVWAMSVAGA